MSRIFKFDNDVDTDQIIASQYLLLPNIDEMKSHAFESLDADFASGVKDGDIIVAGDNFGCGSSREQAPSVLKALGIKAVYAKSFARIFYRNSINIKTSISSLINSIFALRLCSMAAKFITTMSSARTPMT